MGKNAAEVKPLAVITGASSGIGYELAAEFAKAGFDLIVTADDDAIQRVKEALQDAHVDITAVQSDLSTPEGVDRVLEAVAEAKQPLVAIALNAGIGLSGDFVRETDLNEALKLIRLNVMAPVAMAKLLIPQMLERGEGRVLVTSSIASLSPGPFHAVYHASKAFIQSFAEALREELKDSGVTVTSLMPGATETQFFARADMLDTKVGQAKKDDAGEVAKQGFKAMMKGDDHVVAGSFMNKVQAIVSKFLSEEMKAKQVRSQNEPIEDQEDEVDAVTMLTRQHRVAEALMDRIEKGDVKERRPVMETLARKLMDHMTIEEDVFYPAANPIAKELIVHSKKEHAAAKAVISTLKGLSGEDARFMTNFQDLKAKIMDHVHDEEDDLFPICRDNMTDDQLLDLADEMRDLLVGLENEDNGSSRGQANEAGREATT